MDHRQQCEGGEKTGEQCGDVAHPVDVEDGAGRAPAAGLLATRRRADELDQSLPGTRRRSGTKVDRCPAADRIGVEAEQTVGRHHPSLAETVESGDRGHDGDADDAVPAVAVGPFEVDRVAHADIELAGGQPSERHLVGDLRQPAGHGARASSPRTRSTPTRPTVVSPTRTWSAVRIISSPTSGSFSYRRRRSLAHGVDVQSATARSKVLPTWPRSATSWSRLTPKIVTPITPPTRTARPSCDTSVVLDPS